jgi:hypothetical protein
MHRRGKDVRLLEDWTTDVVHDLVLQLRKEREAHAIESVGVYRRCWPSLGD